jgi:hypothetical protein
MATLSEELQRLGEDRAVAVQPFVNAARGMEEALLFLAANVRDIDNATDRVTFHRVMNTIRDTCCPGRDTYDDQLDDLGFSIGLARKEQIRTKASPRPSLELYGIAIDLRPSDGIAELIYKERDDAYLARLKAHAASRRAPPPPSPVSQMPGYVRPQDISIDLTDSEAPMRKCQEPEAD